MRLALLALLALLVLAPPAAAQRIVPVHEEPRHQLVHDGDGFRVLDVRVAPGDTTYFHTHDAPITYVSIVPSPMDSQPLGGAWTGNGPDDPPPFAAGEVAWDLSYAERPVHHRVTNVGGGPFRLVAIINYGPGDQVSMPRTGSPPDTAEEENAWFRVSRVTVDPGEVFTWGETGRHAVAVVVDGGEARLSQRNGRAVEIEGPGALFVQRAGTEHEIRALGGTAIELVLIDIK